MKRSESDGSHHHARFGERSIAWPLLLAIAISCGRPPEGRTPEERMLLEKQARALAIQVETGAPEDDAVLTKKLEAFLETTKSGRSSIEVRLLLAKVLLRRGQQKRANHEAFVVLSQKGLLPRHRDSARLIQAETLLRSGQPALAVEILAPLTGQLFELADRRACARFLVEASLASARYELVFPALLERLELERMPLSSLTAEIDGTLAKIPVATLKTLGVPTETKNANLRELLVERLEKRLADVAVARNDAELAREVLRRKPAWLRGTAEYEELVKLTLLLEDEARVIGQRVGIVLGGKSSLERSRSISLMMGFVAELRDEKKLDISVLSEDDPGSVSEALSRLTSEGASLLIAGFRAETSLEALRFAEDRRVSVLTIAPPASVPPQSFGFRAGPSDEDAERILRAAASDKGFPTPNLVTEENCVSGSGSDGGALLVLAGADCLRVVLRNFPSTSLFLGLDVSGEPLPPGRSSYFLRAYSFPEKRPASATARSGGTSSDREPRFYELLGRDLAKLAARAFEGPAERELADRSAVLARYSELRDRLLRVRTELATTSLSGFTAENSLGHELRVERFEAPKKP